MKPVTLTTADGVELHGSYGDADGPYAVLFLHMLGKDRSSWRTLPEALHQQGFSVLSLDFRGHGESTVHVGQQRTLNHENFCEADFFPAMRLDVLAARRFLCAQGKEAQVLVGASMGANLALWELGDPGHQSYAVPGQLVDLAAPLRVVCVSPGLSYCGIPTQPALEMAANRLKSDQGAAVASRVTKKPVALLMASTDDPYSHQSVGSLAGALEGAGALRVTTDYAGHGTDIFLARPELGAEVVRFVCEAGPRIL